MKQGSGNSSRGDTEVEPRSHSVNVDAVADIGIKHIKRENEPLYVGRGFEAPKAMTTIHKSGSQRG